MALIKKVKRGYQVRQGNNNELLGTFKARGKAAQKVKDLHAKFKPKAAHKGAKAAAKFRKH